MKKLTLTVVALSFLSGCASIDNPGKKIPALPPATIHTYSAGDTFVYNDGYTEQVISTAPHEVRWGLGPTPTSIVRTVNFFDPPIQWKLDGMSYSFEKSSRTGALWPLHEGAEAFLSGQLNVYHRNGTQSFDQNWICNVTQSERLLLKIGTFDTFVVDCKRQSDSGAHWQRRRFNYAPSLGHSVRVIEEMKAHGYPGYVFKQRDLVYFRTGNSAAFNSAFHQALSTMSSGQVFSYEHNGSNYKAEIRSTSMGEAGDLCREIDVQDEQSVHYSADYCLLEGAWTLRSMTQEPRRK